MEPYQLDANEQFFLNVISCLKEGGKWLWPAEQKIFTLKEDKLQGTQEAYDAVSQIVRPEFLKEHFVTN